MFKSASDFVSELVRLEKEMDGLESLIGFDDPASYDEDGEFRGPFNMWAMDEFCIAQQRYKDLFNSPWIYEAYHASLLTSRQLVHVQELAKNGFRGYNADDPIMNLANWIKAGRDAAGKDASSMFKRVKYTMPDGTVKNIGGNSEQERAEQYLEFMGMTAEKTETKTSAPLMREAAEKWFVTWREGTITEKGKVADIKNKHTSIYTHIIPKLGEIPLNELNEDYLQTFMNQFKSRSTANKQRDILLQILNRPSNLPHVNPYVLAWFKDKKHGAKCSKAKAKQYGYSEKTAREIYEAIPKLQKPRERAYMWFALMAGMRRGEILALRFEDIDLEAGMINVTKAVSFADDDHNSPTIKTPKNGEARQIPLVDEIRKCLEEMPYHDGYIIRLAENVKAREGKNGPITQSSYRRMWESIRKQIPVLTTGLMNEFQNKGCHHLRHTFASMIVNCNTAPETAAKILGHKDVSVTLNVYAEALDSGMTNARNVMKGMFDRAP